MLQIEGVLDLWQQQASLEETRHLLWGELRRLADAGEHDWEFAHLALCPWCRQRLWRFQQARSHGGVDYVQPWAAATNTPQEPTWTTQDGKYKIELRKIVGTPHRAVLIVQTQTSLDPAGKTLLVEDAHGRELLRGVVNSDGLVASEIDDLRAISLQELVVIEV